MNTDTPTEATRIPYLGLSSIEMGIWNVLTALCLGIFLWGIIILYRKYTRGRKVLSVGDMAARLWGAAVIIFSHAWIRRRDQGAGLAHACIFYGFLTLFIGTSILFIQTDIVGPLFGWQFWQGNFYLLYSLVLDLLGLALLLGLTYMVVRRATRKPKKLDYSRTDRDNSPSRGRYVIGDWVFLGVLLFLVVSGFLLEAMRITITGPEFEKWSTIGWWLASQLRELSVSPESWEFMRHSLWWIHGVVALSFVASIPFTKAVHMLVAPFSVAARDPHAGRRFETGQEEDTEEEIGYEKISSFSSKHLLSLDACTKCGKCHEACPAHAGGFPLSPRDLILDLRELSSVSMGGISAALSLEAECDASQSILDKPIKSETLWSCMQCMACTEICPVGIQHVPIINQMRRALVENGEMDTQLQSTLETIYNSGNSFGEAKRKRANWAKQMEKPIKDIRKEPAEFLWFVGDYASYDPRNQKVTTTLAKILQHTGTDFGLLYDAERTAGNDVRRVGEEGLWESLAEENIGTIGSCDYKYILTSDPHTFNTVKNEYPQLGAPWDPSSVMHHSQLLYNLTTSSVISLTRKLDYRVTYHDPCHIGRYNGIYEEPRKLLEALGLTLIDMPRNRDNSFCCGAGGGRIWMTEPRFDGCQRPGENRIEEAVSLGNIDYFVVACPKDVTMYEDAIKTSGHHEKIALREISELVAEAMGISSY